MFSGMSVVLRERTRHVTNVPDHIWKLIFKIPHRYPAYEDDTLAREKTNAIARYNNPYITQKPPSRNKCTPRSILIFAGVLIAFSVAAMVVAVIYGVRAGKHKDKKH